MLLTEAYSVRVSNRARKVQLKLCPIKGLEVVVPRGFNHQKIPQVVRENTNWLERARSNLEKRTAHLPAGHLDAVPSMVSLLYVNQIRHITVKLGDALPLNDDGDTLFVHALNEVEVRKKLKNWLRSQARKHLVPALKSLSQELGLDYAKTSIRNQKTRWGSCSSRGMISLNYRMILLPAELVRYLLIHELCHTKHMNHSKRYWALVETFDPDFRQHEKALKASQCYLPYWLDME